MLVRKDSAAVGDNFGCSGGSKETFGTVARPPTSFLVERTRASTRASSRRRQSAGRRVRDGTILEKRMLVYYTRILFSVHEVYRISRSYQIR